MDRTERLKRWVESLPDAKKDELLVMCVGELIDSELFNMWDDTEIPFWDATGENIDGSVREV